MKFNVVTLFPQLFDSWLENGLIGKAVSRQDIQVNFVNPREFTQDKHKTVDDRPFGGGDGMIMLYEPLAKSIDHLKAQNKCGKVIYLSPHGTKLTSAWAQTAAGQNQPLTLVSGRYGGVDQRFIEEYVDEEISIGDFILCGGELPAMCLMESVSRFLPNVLGNELSSQNESFQEGLLEAPQFTRPADLDVGSVPKTLLEGHHKKINELRQSLALVVSHLKRPDLTTGREEEVKKAAKELSRLSEKELFSCGISVTHLNELGGL